MSRKQSQEVARADIRDTIAAKEMVAKEDDAMEDAAIEDAATSGTPEFRFVTTFAYQIFYLVVMFVQFSTTR